MIQPDVHFILGAGRSGTTLLRVMLAGHPRLFSPPEMLLAPFATMAERVAHLEKRYWEKGGLQRAIMDLRGSGVDEARAEVQSLADRTVPEVYAHLASLAGGRAIVDKCPHLSIDVPLMRRTLEWFPNARFLWIVRHPGSVIRSFGNMPMSEVMFQGYEHGVEDYWVEANSKTRQFLSSLPFDRWAMIRYEDLVRDPRREMERACAALAVPFDEATLKPYEGERMREGPKGARAIGDPNFTAHSEIDPAMAEKWLDGFDARSLSEPARALAAELGYELDFESKTPIARLGDAMRSLFETAKTLDRDTTFPSDLDSVEGRRFLLRMLSASVDTFVEQSDVERPRFHHSEGPYRKMFADCPDTDYLRAPIEVGPGRVYRVWGTIPKGTNYVGVLLYGKGGRVGSRTHDSLMNVATDGTFELFVSTERPERGTWLEAHGDETAVMVRQYFTDRKKEPPVEVHVELVRPAPKPPAPLDPDAMVSSLEKSERMLKAVLSRTIGAHKMATSMGLNTFVEIGGEQLFPTPDNKYRVAWYRFGGDQLLLVRGRLPRARYVSFSLCNAWMESLDYLAHPRSILNHTQIRSEPDGTFEVCLANENPGHPNWIDTAGHLAGYALVRALLPEESPLPELTTQVHYVAEWKRLKR